jgi:hypothetical protein
MKSRGTNHLTEPFTSVLSPYLEQQIINLLLIKIGAGIVTGYGLDDQGVGVRVLEGSRIFSSPCHPDWFWGPTNFLCMGTGGFFPGGKTPRA